MLDAQNMAHPAPGAVKRLLVHKAQLTYVPAAAGNLYTDYAPVRKMIYPVVHRGFLAHGIPLLTDIFFIISEYREQVNLYVYVNVAHGI
ncbi:hypothetical protein SAMN02745219_00268 [Desulfofundulus thermosubterraneus DSM 16057]|uniref:Uncharacterized protein n=1 Tax=Desulfofundulus thermosubterraneus DSM 16057 TaxID=1121432 RepID=A0A1M6B0X8_9FIRM|nr:hypothetical protein SAMN02745219_00268 [Desulfofundulus thermosubterraneus DSM 16057]